MTYSIIVTTEICKSFGSVETTNETISTHKTLKEAKLAAISAENNLSTDGFIRKSAEMK